MIKKKKKKKFLINVSPVSVDKRLGQIRYDPRYPNIGLKVKLLYCQISAVR